MGDRIRVSICYSWKQVFILKQPEVYIQMQVMQIIENYDQYKGLEESVCMKKELDESNKSHLNLKNLPGYRIFFF